MKITKIIPALLFLPLGAFADAPIKPIDTVYVSSESDFKYRTSVDGCLALDESKDYILKANVTLSHCFFVSSVSAITLDLNGYNLTRDLKNLAAEEKGLLFVVDGALIVKNDNDGRRGVMTEVDETNTNVPAIFINERGAAFLQGGTIKSKSKNNSVFSVHGQLDIGSSVIAYGTGVIAYSGSKVNMKGGSIDANNRGIIANKGSKVTISGGSIYVNYAVEAFEDIDISGNPHFYKTDAIVLSNGKKINIVGELKSDAIINLNIAEPLSDKNPKIALSTKSEYVTKDAINNIFRHVTGTATGYELYAYNNTLMLRKDYPAIRYISEDGKTTAFIDGDYYGSIGDIEAKAVDSVVFERKFPLSANGYSTIMLPFAVNLNQLSGVKNIYKFRGVEEVNGKMEVQVQNLKETFDNESQVHTTAYTPYLIQMESETLEIKGTVDIEKTPFNHDFLYQSGSWFIDGSDEYMEFTQEMLESSNTYGFNDQVTETFKTAGQFVKIGAGATLPPFRAFIFTRDIFTPELKEKNRPVTMDVVIVESTNGNEHTTVIGSINTRSGEFKMNRNYDLKGRKLNGTHQARGAYYGKKILKK
jgi:hypothetical protein